MGTPAGCATVFPEMALLILIDIRRINQGSFNFNITLTMLVWAHPGTTWHTEATLLIRFEFFDGVVKSVPFSPLSRALSSDR